MLRPSRLLGLAVAATLALAPALADARPGSRASSGSRGERTFTPPPSTNTAPGQAMPMERTMQQPAARPAGPTGAPMGTPAGAAAASSGRPFMAGLMGGLIGVGIGGLLFGSGMFGGLDGMAGFLGFILQVGLIALLVWLVVGFFRRRSAAPALAGMPNGMAREMERPAMPQVGRPGGAATSAPVTLNPGDFSAFEACLKAVNAAWSRQDQDALARLCTPEMQRYFADDLARLTAQGLRNETRDVTLAQGDLSEAWREGTRDYATVAMRFSLIDVTRRIADGVVAEGDPNRPTEASELWTFVRIGAGDWHLSAIQQTR